MKSIIIFLLSINVCIAQSILDSLQLPNYNKVIYVNESSSLKFSLSSDGIQSSFEINGASGFNFTTNSDSVISSSINVSNGSLSLSCKNYNGTSVISVDPTTGDQIIIQSYNLDTNKSIMLSLSTTSGAIKLLDDHGRGLQYVIPPASSITNSVMTRGYITGAKSYSGKQIFTNSASSSGLRVGTFATDPSTASNGEIYYNTTINKFKIYQNNAWMTIHAD
jgi:hypothetical protein